MRVWLTVLALGMHHASADLNSVTPPDGALGVAPTSTVVFAFSAPMDPLALAEAVQFYDNSSGTSVTIPVNSVWTAADSILSCTPQPGFPHNRMITWNLFALSLQGEVVFAEGSFKTESVPSGTNATSAFLLSKAYEFEQSSPAAPLLLSSNACYFIGTASLASNRSANLLTLTLPNSTVSNLLQSYSAPENHSLLFVADGPPQLSGVFPDGNYQFGVLSSTTQYVSVTLPGAATHPNAPQITNFAAAQLINPSRDFRLGWAPLQSASSEDLILVQIRQGENAIPLPLNGEVAGTNTGLVIPAGTLNPLTNYQCRLTFLRQTFSTNTDHVTRTLRSSTTSFGIAAATSISTITLSKPVKNAEGFAFDLLAPAGLVYVESCTNLASGVWHPLQGTNSAGTTVHIVDRRNLTAAQVLYRAWTQ